MRASEKIILGFGAALAVTALALAAGTNIAGSAGGDRASVERGRYLVQAAGCNDCHTPGYAAADGRVDERLWLTGDTVGWSGPWGTTYPPNLRRYLSAMSEDQWVETARTLRTRPPMPWFNVNMMHEDDLRSIYRYATAAGPAGEMAPPFVPPGVEPPGPAIRFP